MFRFVCPMLFRESHQTSRTVCITLTIDVRGRLFQHAQVGDKNAASRLKHFGVHATSLECICNQGRELPPEDDLERRICAKLQRRHATGSRVPKCSLLKRDYRRGFVKKQKTYEKFKSFKETNLVLIEFTLRPLDMEVRFCGNSGQNKKQFLVHHGKPYFWGLNLRDLRGTLYISNPATVSS
ncbi:hypothetical protein L596_004842 [Steinernema carpocapsae]|uniref:Uncharacterized protein n=1 Tax=Steinernema carpocapsae TaxID=34508 RepID=A0A4U8V0M7_STECR|nr:hypothetical protein L596_004842 [Steinernema carpocapsae]